MTAILSMCLDDGAFLATDAGFESLAGDAGDPQGRIFQLDRYTALSGAGHVPAIRRVAVEVGNRIADDDSRDEVLGATKRTIGSVSETARRNYPDRETAFQIVVTGYARERESGYVAVLESPDVEDPQRVIKSDPRDLHVSGSNPALLQEIHANMQEAVITQFEGVPLDVWATNVLSVASSKDEAVSMPATYVLVDSDGYHESVSDTRVASPDERYRADLY